MTDLSLTIRYSWLRASWLKEYMVLKRFLKMTASGLLCASCAIASASESQIMLNFSLPFGSGQQTVSQRLSGSLDFIDARQQQWPLLSSRPSHSAGPQLDTRQIHLLNVPLAKSAQLNAVDGLSGGTWAMIGLATVGVVSAVVLSSNIDDAIERCNSEEARRDPTCFDQSPDEGEDESDK